MIVDLLNNPSILSSLVLPRKSFCFDVPDFFFLFLSLKGRIIGGGTRLGGGGTVTCFCTKRCFGLGMLILFRRGVGSAGGFCFRVCTGVCSWVISGD